MKAILRTFVYVFLSLALTNYIVKTLSFGSEHSGTFVTVTFALSLLYFFLKPLIRLLSLPTKGVGFWFLAFVTTTAILYAASVFVPGFSLKSTTLSGLIIFGFVLPSKHLEGYWVVVFTALLISFFYTFFDWLSAKK